MAEFGAKSITSLGRGRGPRTGRVCDPATISACGPSEPALVFSELDCDVAPLKPVGRTRGRRTVPVLGPLRIPSRGPHEPLLGFSESSSKEETVQPSYDCASGSASKVMVQMVPEYSCDIYKQLSTMAIDHTQFDIPARPQEPDPFPPTVWTRPSELKSKQGTSGKVVPLNANYFELPTMTTWQLYQYRVSFSPSDLGKVAKYKMVREYKEKLGGYLFDGKMLYTSFTYDEDPMVLTSTRLSDGVTLTVTIKSAGILAFGDHSYMQVYNILLRHCLQKLGLQQVSRFFFNPMEGITVDKHKMELWPGYVTSIRQHENKLLLCVDVTHKVMRQDTVHDFLKECYNFEPASYQKLFKGKILGSIVLTDYNNKTYRVDDVDFSASPQSVFHWNGKAVSYIFYFSQKYQLTIRDKSQPMLVSRPKKNYSHNDDERLIYLVPELCRMTGLTDRMRSNYPLMQDLAKYTRLNPSQRVERLQKFNRCLKANREITSELTSWNLSMSEMLVSLSGRTLPQEVITFGKCKGQGNAKCVAGPMNDWTKVMSEKPMLTSQQVGSWAVVFPSRMKDDVNSFVSTLRNAAAKMELKLPQPYGRAINGDHIVSYMEALEETVLICNPQLILVVIPNNNLDRYSAIKRKCCAEMAVPTQVILRKSIDRKFARVNAVATKVALQINCKLGGAPWTMDIPVKDLMVMGFDVYPAKNGKSIGAFVASLDGNLSRYYSAVRYHDTGEELSKELSISIGKAIGAFIRHNEGRLPKRIVIYRDGVGDGQISYVYKHEVALIKSELEKIYGGTSFRMAFIIVTKHINTRLFLGNENPPPGTVVDDVITLPERYDFYLVSQSVRQGTVTPTLYNVISDNVGLDPDKLQRLTYKMTHMYYNWSGTIRVPAPVQYAHKLAYLVGQAIHKYPREELNELLYYL